MSGGILNWQTDREEKSHLRTLWVWDHNGRWWDGGDWRRWRKQPQWGLWWESESTGWHNTCGELAGMTEPKEEKGCVGFTVILLMRYSCAVLAFLSQRCGHLLLPLITSGEQSWSTLIHTSCSWTSPVRAHVCKLAICSKKMKNGGDSLLPWKPALACGVTLFCVAYLKSFLHDSRGRWWGVKLWTVLPSFFLPDYSPH